ncbi:MAG: D-alanyl-D-alanine carboxypeptidase/D-alanyl-D-alanine-endopeptidase [Prosthecobacter sp.]|uniref:D-alanyl-D-alanine carboxypeptidase/D-alanyl-D-alanine endopeptidase n=1 Tax=Prosthecobacter sp. TaxID=1965333 RepID=UPI003BAFCECE
MLKNIVILLLASALAASLLLRRDAGSPAAPSVTSAPLPARVEPPAIVPSVPVPVTTPTEKIPPQEAPPAPLNAVAKVLQEARANPVLTGTSIGFCLIDSKGAVTMDENAGTALIPASSFKTLTTATALEVLGPDFHFTTELKSTAPIQEGVIKGDLVIIGGGDPMLKLDDLKAWAADLKQRGLVRITGTIRVDASFFSGSLYGDFWNWGDIGNGYGSGVAGLNLNHNRYILMFQAGPEVGSPAQLLGINLEVPGAIWKNEVTTGPADSGDGVMIHGGENTTAIYLRGTVPLGAAKFQARGAVPDPARFAAHHFRAALQDAGIQVGSPGTGASPAKKSGSGNGPAKSSGSEGATSIAPASPIHSLLKHDSPPLLDIIKSIHKVSDNQETECVFRMLGLKAGKPSAEVIREHWKTRGLEFAGLRMEDGSGLSRADFIRPLDLARLQFLAGTGPQGIAYKASLLSENGLTWKIGAMSGIRSYTGYAKTKSGEEYCYALMVNHYTDGKTVSELCRLVLDAMMGL